MSNKVLVLLAAFVCVLWSIRVAAATDAEFPTCDRSAVQGGDLLYLTSKQGRAEYCWRKVTISRISPDNLAERGGYYNFVYVFGRDDLTNDFDPIFNVKAKTVARTSNQEKLSGDIHLFRPAMDTLCDKRSFDIFRVDKHFNEFSGAVSGAVYNAYHKDGAGVPTSALNNFHVFFRDSRGDCRRTDASDLRKLFAISDIDFRDKSRIAKIISGLLGASTATATETGPYKYSDVLVSIGKGRFKNQTFFSSFKLAAGREYRIVVNDLSTYDRYSGNRRRPTVDLDLLSEGDSN